MTSLRQAATAILPQEGGPAAVPQVLAGGVLAVVPVAGVFWFTFRRPPPPRRDAAPANRDADHAMRNLRDDGRGGLS